MKQLKTLKALLRAPRCVQEEGWTSQQNNTAAEKFAACSKCARLHQNRVQKSQDLNCTLPELACDVTKSKITAIVIWASLILRFTFHLIWVSMTARDVHGKVD